MRLRALHIGRLPGIQPGFTLDDLAPGVNVVVGPNASGKSSLVRALRAALYRDASRHEGVHVEATFTDERAGATLAALRIGDDLHWRHDGQAAEAPALPERRFLSCYTLGVEDLLDDTHDTDAEIAERLARELAGGYDLRSVRESAPFRLKSTHGRTEANALTEADQALRRHMQAQQQLLRDEGRLGTLREEKTQAESARREAELHERALDLLEKRRQCRALEQRLEDFPAGMERLRGDEPDTLAELRERLQRQEAERREATESRASAEASLQASGLAETALDEGALDDHRPTLNRLRQVETELAGKETEYTEAEATRAAAIDALGGEPGQTVRLDPAMVGKVEQALEERRALEAERRYLEHEQAHLPAADAPDPDPERLRTARGELLRWLTAPRAPAWTATRVLALLALLGAGGAGIALAGLEVDQRWYALVLPLLLGVYFVVRRPALGDQRRREAEARFRESGEQAPEEWAPEPVEARLGALDRAVVEAEREAQRIERGRTVTRELDTRREALQAVDNRLRQVAQRVGHDPAALDASLQRWLRLVSDYDQAQRNTETVRADRDRLAAEADRLRAQLLTFLGQHGECPQHEAPGADALSSRIDRLAARLRQRDKAYQDMAQADRAIQRLDREIDTAREKIQGVFDAVGLAHDDDAALRLRMERLEDWREVTRQLRETRGIEADRREELGERDDLLQRVTDEDEDGLRARHTTLREQADSLEALIREISRIEDGIERAGQERALEAARARYRQAREDLSDRLDEAIYAEAGQFLLEGIEAEHEQAVQPAALRQAREWFRRFTHYQYELVFSTDGGTRFAARETTSGEHRRLSELSSGTRMQLLLAVRIAFALSAERGATRLPLVLDEALTTADPERFRAVAESLTLLAREDGRQVFYLTAQPDDARYWAEYDPDVHCIDLAARRGRETAVDAPEALTPAERPTVPALDGQSAEEYAVTIGVPPIDPWSEVEGIHIFYLLRDELALLQRLLGLSVDRVGQLETLLASDAADTVLSAEQRGWLRARVEGVKAWVHAWRHGRGRPVNRAALEASGAVSGTFMERVVDLNDRLGGDGEALIERLAAGDVARFQTDKREELRAWLLDHGYISGDEALSGLEIELRVVSTLKSCAAEGTDVTADARTLLQSLEGGLQS